MFEDDKPPFEVTTGTVEVGKSYPLYGMITKILSEQGDKLVVIINGIDGMKGTELTLSLGEDSQDKIEVIKSRFFEPGIFVTQITEAEPDIKGDCNTVIFGRSQTKEVQ